MLKKVLRPALQGALRTAFGTSADAFGLLGGRATMPKPSDDPKTPSPAPRRSGPRPKPGPDQSEPNDAHGTYGQPDFSPAARRSTLRTKRAGDLPSVAPPEETSSE